MARSGSPERGRTRRIARRSLLRPTAIRRHGQRPRGRLAQIESAARRRRPLRSLWTSWRRLRSTVAMRVHVGAPAAARFLRGMKEEDERYISKGGNGSGRQKGVSRCGDKHRGASRTWRGGVHAAAIDGVLLAGGRRCPCPPLWAGLGQMPRGPR